VSWQVYVELGELLGFVIASVVEEKDELLGSRTHSSSLGASIACSVCLSLPEMNLSSFQSWLSTSTTLIPSLVAPPPTEVSESKMSSSLIHNLIFFCSSLVLTILRE